MTYSGYPMAKNLQAKLPPTDTLIVYDRKTETTSKFAQEVAHGASRDGAGEKGAKVEIGSSVRQAAEKSVRAEDFPDMIHEAREQSYFDDDQSSEPVAQCKNGSPSGSKNLTDFPVTILADKEDRSFKQEVIITTLPEPNHVKNAFHSILHPPLPSITFTDPNTTERLFIDCSTIDPTSSREVANAVHSTAQGRFVDAPMSGGVVGAQAGTLTFMLGAHTKHGGLIKYRVRPLLEMMGTRVLHLGGQGAGLSAKLANNYLLAISNIATAEAMNLGQRCGLDPHILSELINGSSGRCWSSEVNNPVPGVSPGAPAEKDYEGGFAVELMKKDLALALEEASRVGARTELGERAGQVYEAVVAAEPGKDFSVMYKWLDGPIASSSSSSS
ncbi:MAG: hypothetical protein Q9163_002808 [Psora crenata]